MRTASEESIINSVLDDDKLRLMMKVCKYAPKCLNSLESKMYETIAPLKCEAWVTDEPVTFENKENGKHMLLSVGDVWSENVFACAWFHITGDVPS